MITWKIYRIHQLVLKEFKTALNFIKPLISKDEQLQISFHFSYKDTYGITHYRSQSRLVILPHTFDKREMSSFFYNKAKEIISAAYEAYDVERYWFRYTIIKKPQP